MNALDPQKILKGLEQKPDPELSEGLVEAVDIDFPRIGSCKSSLTNDTMNTYGSSVHSLSWEAVSGTDKLFIGYGTSIDADGTNLTTSFSGEDTEFSSMLGRAYMTNPTNGVWSYNGTALYRAGSPTPSTAPTVGDSGSGTGFNCDSTNPYLVKITFTNGNGFDGSASSAGTLSSITDNTISVTNIPVNSNTDYNITSRKVWIFGGTGPVYTDYVLAATISDNTTTTATLTTAGVDTETILVEDNDTPPNFKQILAHANVMWGFEDGSNDLQASRAASGTEGPEQWPLDQIYTLSRSGDYLKSICEWDAELFAFTRKKIYQIIGSAGSGLLAANFFPKETRSVAGTNALRSVCATPMGIYFQADDGWRLFNGNESVIISDPVIDEFESMSQDVAYKALTTCHYANNKLFISFVLQGSTVPDRTVVFDFQTQTWTAHNKGYKDFAYDLVNELLYLARGTSVERYRHGSTYEAWSFKTHDFTTRFDGYTSWGRFQVDMEGSATANIYLDGTLAQTYSLSSSSRGLVDKRFPLGLSQRMSVELEGTAKSTQDTIYGFGLSAEAQQGGV